MAALLSSAARHRNTSAAFAAGCFRWNRKGGLFRPARHGGDSIVHESPERIKRTPAKVELRSAPNRLVCGRAWRRGLATRGRRRRRSILLVCCVATDCGSVANPSAKPHAGLGRPALPVAATRRRSDSLSPPTDARFHLHARVWQSDLRWIRPSIRDARG
jgi:hypothetical protein